MKMVNYEASDFYMLRTPLLSLNFYEDLFGSKLTKEDQEKKILNIMESEILREAIAVSSPSLIESVNRIETIKDEKKRNKIITSLIKYLIRMSARTTPYGIFSGVTVGDFGHNSKVEISPVENHKKRARIDMEWIYAVIKKIEADATILSELKVRFNELNYKNGVRIENPYVSNCGQFYTEEGNDTMTASIRYTKQVQFVERTCTEFVKFGELLNIIRNNNPEINSEKINDFLKKLLENEYLISELRPPLINTNPIEYILKILKEIDKAKHFYSDLYEIELLIEKYNETPVGKGIEIYFDIYNKMKKLHECKNYLQVDLKLESKSNTLNKNISEELEKTVQALVELSSEIMEPDNIREYRNEFIDKYGSNVEVPVMEILDSDIGIGAPAGYSSPRSNKEIKSMSNSIKLKRYKRILNNKILAAIRDQKYEIEITDEDIKSINKDMEQVSSKNLPNSFELNVFVSAKSEKNIDKEDFKLFIGPNFGSHSAGKTFGRFADLLSEKATNKLNLLHLREKELVKDEYLFAEIFELPQKGRGSNICLNYNNVDNQVAIATNHCDGKKKISIKDLFLGIDETDNNSFYIKSKSLNKKIIFTANNMMNFRFNSNVCRFLKEISYTNKVNVLNTLAMISSSEYVYTPRITYGKTVLSLATWTLSEETLGDKITNKNEFIKKFQTFMNTWNIPRYVYQKSGDNRLLLDLENETHFDELFNIYKNSVEDVTICETEGNLDMVWVKNNKSERHFSEVVIPFFLNKNKIDDVKKAFNENTLNTKSDVFENVNKIGILDNSRILLPGNNNWLYFKLYGNSKRAEELIGLNILEYCEKLKAQKIINKYFFIRYADPHIHVRLRIEGTQEVNILTLMPELNRWFNTLKEEGLVSSIVIDTYNREIERYGGIKLINLAEEFFYRDSQYVGYLLKLKRFGELRLKDEYIGIASIVSILDTYVLDFETQEKLLSSIVTSKEFRSEFKGDRENYLKIANSSNDWEHLRGFESGEILYQLFDKRNEALTNYKNKIFELDDTGELSNTKTEILLSLTHMFCNKYMASNNWERKIMALIRHSFYSLKHLKKNNL